MNEDFSSLDNLKPILEPEPISWWPLAPGWWVLIILLLSFMFIACWKQYSQWKKNAYRRTALKELEKATDIEKIANILKRTAIARCPQERNAIASLSGSDWCDWLSSVSQLSISNSVQATLTVEVYKAGSELGFQELKEFSFQWIQSHSEVKSHSSFTFTKENAS